MFNFQSDFYKFATLANLAAAGVACFFGNPSVLLWVFIPTGVGLTLRAMRHTPA